MARKSEDKSLEVDALTHKEARRRNIPTAEFQSVMKKDEQNPIRIAYERRNRDLDPQLVWKGKDEQDWSDLVVHAPPLYIQEKVHPKVLVEELRRESELRTLEEAGKGKGFQFAMDLFGDFNGLPKEAVATDFYQHDGNWTNRMILGDSLQVMASLAEREGLRGQVQCIYLDPPYGIKFNSNFQWSTTSRDVKDGKKDHISREPEQVKAFRDTWRDGIHSYLTYLRDRLTVARDLLADSGSIFVQIGDENVHRVRALMDEVFGEDNFVSEITYAKTTGFSSSGISNITDHIVWYCKNNTNNKIRRLFTFKTAGDEGASKYREASTISALSNSVIDLTRLATSDQLTSQGASVNSEQLFTFRKKEWAPSKGLHWKTTVPGLGRIGQSGRIVEEGKSIRYIRFLDDFSIVPQTNVWLDIGGVQSRTDPKVYVVQTATEAIKRCILMSTDPGDLVLDPTCGSGTTAHVAEQWGRRWITIDTSRVALALARARVMGARFPFYLLTDSPEGQKKEAEVTRTVPSSNPTHGNIRQGFVYQRVPHITLKAIANNVEIDVIWEKFQDTLEPLREELNVELGKKWQEWEIPREAEDPWSNDNQTIFHKIRSEQGKGTRGKQSEIESGLAALNHNLKRRYTLDTLPERPADPWPDAAATIHKQWLDQRIARQQEIDASIAAKADFEFLYDKPYEDRAKVRVAGPFTVESLSPHRVLTVDQDDELVDPDKSRNSDETDFAAVILENLKTAGVQQAHKADKINFTAITGWPGHHICAEGRYMEEETERRAGILIGPEFGTVSRPDLVSAAREAGDAGFDALIACAFNFDAHSAEFDRLGRIPVLKARMNADLHMADDLKNTGKGNLFVIFGEPDIDIMNADGGQIQIKINGVDVFKPQTGEVEASGPDGIACWFIDTDYNEESFFVRHAYFLGANDPYKALKTTLKTEIDREAWESLHSDTSRPFDKPKSGRIAVKVINHLGDEVMKVFGVE